MESLNKHNGRRGPNEKHRHSLQTAPTHTHKKTNLIGRCVPSFPSSSFGHKVPYFGVRK